MHGDKRSYAGPGAPEDGRACHAGCGTQEEAVITGDVDIVKEVDTNEAKGLNRAIAESELSESELSESAELKPAK